MLVTPQNPDRKTNRWTPASIAPRTLAGRRLVDRHHVPRSLADAIAAFAGLSVEEAG
jgi:hypothetical protein